jgi:fused signal recognition particle receptor
MFFWKRKKEEHDDHGSDDAHDSDEAYSSGDVYGTDDAYGSDDAHVSDTAYDPVGSFGDEEFSGFNDEEADGLTGGIDSQDMTQDDNEEDEEAFFGGAADETSEEEEAIYPEEPVKGPVEEKKGFFARLFEGLTKTRNSILGGLDGIFSAFSSIDDDFYDELEEVMITSDMGVRTTDTILEKLRGRVKDEHIREPEACRGILIDSIREQMDVGPNAYEYENRTSVLLVVGVNGVGKTTSIGKLASQMKKEGKKVLLAAADTFRAGAVEQLAEWSRRAGVDLISSGEGADPAAVVFDAVSAAKARKTDILIVDTAGRLHNKKNLMEELRKISRVIDREFPDAYRETLAVVDATTGQNALSQAREFMEVAEVSGIILTKMDGTAKGGIAVAIQSELHIPVKYIGVGEQIDDLQKFNADQYVRALFGSD